MEFCLKILTPKYESTKKTTTQDIVITDGGALASCVAERLDFSPLILSSPEASWTNLENHELVIDANNKVNSKE